MTPEPPMPPTSLALTVPNEIRSLTVDASRFELAAADFEVDSEAAFQVADQIQTSLKVEAKKINDQRLEFTRPIDAIKKKWLDWFAPATEGRLKAATIYQLKMSAYRREQQANAEAARRQAEELLRREREAKEAEARRLEEKAARLKTPAAVNRALAEAQEVRQVAAMMPETVAVVAAEPQTVASNVATIWKADIVNPAEFLGWLITRPEWLSCVTFQTGEMNRLARQMRDAVAVPGVKFSPTDSYRTKSR